MGRKKTVNPKVWQHMDGETPAEQKINSFLTCKYIDNKEAPPNECLPEAINIVEISKQDDAQEKVAAFLEDHFAGGSSFSRIRLFLGDADTVLKLID